MIKTIVAAITNDNMKTDVVNTAISMARRYNSDLIFIHVNQIVIPQAGTMDYVHHGPITVESLNREEMQEIAHLARNATIKNVEGKIVEGLDAGSVITAEVKKLNADLLVLADGKKHSFVEKMLGTTASTIVKNVECSVFIVK